MEVRGGEVMSIDSGSILLVPSAFLRSYFLEDGEREGVPRGDRLFLRFGFGFPMVDKEKEKKRDAVLLVVRKSGGAV
jgi:hypothetical protein